MDIQCYIADFHASPSCEIIAFYTPIFSTYYFDSIVQIS